jgi:hypothetical protein
MGIELTTTEKSYPMGSELKTGFSSQLSWSHYRALMRVAKSDARDFYERESIECGWDKQSLERERRLIEAHLAEDNGELLSNRITG